MVYVLDDTEVNTPVYEKLLRPILMRKPRRALSFIRVKRLEENLRLLREQLPPNSIAGVSATQMAIEVKSTKVVARRAKQRVRRGELSTKL